MFKKIYKKYSSMSDIAKSAFWYTVCNFLTKAISLLVTPIFTRIMTEEQYGAFAIFQSWFNILIIFTSLNVFLSGYTKGLVKYKNDKENFTSSQLALTTIITTIFLAIYGINIGFWTNVFNLPPILMFAMFAELLAMPAYELWMARKRFEYEYKSVVVISLLMNITSLIVSVVAVMMASDKLEARVFSDVGLKVIFALPIFMLLIIKGRKFINLKYWKYALAFNIPLIPHYLSNYVLNQSDRIMIGRMVGNVQAGYYSVSYTIATVMVLLVTALNTAITPHTYKVIDSGNKEEVKKIKDIITYLCIFVAAMCLSVALFAPEVIYVFAGEKYMESIYIIPPVAASVFFIFAYSFFSTIEYFYQKNTKIAIATTTCAIVNIILNYVGIKMFGYIAAGYTTLLCYALLAFLHYVFYKQVSAKEMPGAKIYDTKIIFVTSIALVISSILVSLTYSFTIIRYIIITLAAILIVIFRKKIADVFKKIPRSKNNV